MVQRSPYQGRLMMVLLRIYHLVIASTIQKMSLKDLAALLALMVRIFKKARR